MSTFLRDIVQSGNEIEVTLDFFGEEDEPHLQLRSRDELNSALKEQVTNEICEVLTCQYPAESLRQQCYHHHFSFMKCQCGDTDCKNTILIHTEVGEF